jgi:hypothetical protein
MFTKDYPHLTWWVENQGWIEVGVDNTLIKVLDSGGDVYEDDESEDFDRAFKRADKFLKNYIEDELGEEV